MYILICVLDTRFWRRSPHMYHIDELQLHSWNRMYQNIHAFMRESWATNMARPEQMVDILQMAHANTFCALIHFLLKCVHVCPIECKSVWSAWSFHMNQGWLNWPANVSVVPSYGVHLFVMKSLGIKRSYLKATNKCRKCQLRKWLMEEMGKRQPVLKVPRGVTINEDMGHINAVTKGGFRRWCI